MRPSKHSKELAGAVAEDARRHAIDSAKKRAVAQMADYDTFKNMVLTAHLKPVQAPSTASKGPMQPAWQMDYTGQLIATATPSKHPQTPGLPSVVGNATAAACVRDSESVQNSKVPHSSLEFTREWRRNCPDTATKYSFLKHCGAKAMSTIFKVEITGQLLGELLLVLQQAWDCAVQQQQQQHGSCNMTSNSSNELLSYLQQQVDAQQHCLGQCNGGQHHTTSSEVLSTQCSNINDAGGSDTAAQGNCKPVATQPSMTAGNGPEQQCTGPEHLQAQGHFMVQLLHSLTGAGRFDLNIKLIGSKAKQATAQLCEGLAAALQAAGAHEDIVQLRHVQQKLNIT